MIRAYSDHAANERTFLAWVRTSLAIVAFGFVIEKFNLSLLVMASAGGMDIGRRAMFERLAGPLARYDGLAIVVVGLALIVTAAMRFIRVRRLIDDQDTHDAGGYRAELILSAAVALVVAASSFYLALG